jgi:hypothetical protein
VGISYGKLGFFRSPSRDGGEWAYDVLASTGACVWLDATLRGFFL